MALITNITFTQRRTFTVKVKIQ